MRNPRKLPNGQTYYARYRRRTRRDLPARMPSKKQRKRWRRMLRRLGVTPEQFQARLERQRWWQVRNG